MKNRKTLIVSILVVMVLVLGVGYAVVSTTSLQITGTAATEQRELDVVISAANPTTGDFYGTVSNPVNKTATITVTNMQTKNEEKTVTYTVKNNETDANAKVYIKTPGSDITVTKSDYFGVTTSIDGESNAITVPAGGTETFTVTVKLNKVPVLAEDSTTNITINITADPVQAS